MNYTHYEQVLDLPRQNTITYYYCISVMLEMFQGIPSRLAVMSAEITMKLPIS